MLLPQQTSQQTLLIKLKFTDKLYSVYSYFEKGCRKKCTRQSRKVLGVVLSSLFFKEIEGMAREAKTYVSEC